MSESSSACSTETKKPSPIHDIEDIHLNALKNKSKTYIDPSTGFTCFTEYTHLRRGKCCGNLCRHCPYGWENVAVKNSKTGKLIRKESRVRSGDKENIQRLLQGIETGDLSDFVRKDSMKEKTEHQSGEKDTVMGEEKKEETQDYICSVSDEVIVERGKGGRHGGTFTDKNVPYTRSGDQGTSMLITGERRSKDDLAFEAMGTVDELCSIVGTVHAEVSGDACKEVEKYGELEEWLVDIMCRLFDIGSHIAKPRKIHDHNHDDDSSSDEDEDFIPDGVGGGFDGDHVDILEEWVDDLTERLPELDSFILPTGCRASSQLHVARCVCRRAERRVVPLVRAGFCDSNAAKYLNRLSDFFFTAARWANYCDGKEELQYRRFYRGAKQRNRVAVSLKNDKDEP